MISDGLGTACPLGVQVSQARAEGKIACREDLQSDRTGAVLSVQDLKKWNLMWSRCIVKCAVRNLIH